MQIVGLLDDARKWRAKLRMSASALAGSSPAAVPKEEEEEDRDLEGDARQLPADTTGSDSDETTDHADDSARMEDIPQGDSGDDAASPTAADFTRMPVPDPSSGNSDADSLWSRSVFGPSAPSFSVGSTAANTTSGRGRGASAFAQKLSHGEATAAGGRRRAQAARGWQPTGLGGTVPSPGSVDRRLFGVDDP